MSRKRHRKPKGNNQGAPQKKPESIPVPVVPQTTLPRSPDRPHRRHWCRRIGRATFIWLLESVIGLIPYFAHEASAHLVEKGREAQVGSVLPELCVLAVVISSLALLSLLRDWFQRDVTTVNPLTIALAVANMLALTAGAFMYSYAVNGTLTGLAASVPSWMLVSAMGASLVLAAERGFNATH